MAKVKRLNALVNMVFIVSAFDLRIMILDGLVLLELDFLNCQLNLFCLDWGQANNCFNGCATDAPGKMGDSSNDEEAFAAEIKRWLIHVS